MPLTATTARLLALRPATKINLLLALTMAVSVLLRLASAIFQGDAVMVLPGVQDQISYDELARRVLAGYGFSFGEDWWPATRAGAPTAHWSFLYTLYLTAVYYVVGAHPLAARLLQAVIAGVLYPWFAWRLGRRLFGTKVGLVSAMLISVYAYFVYYAGALMSETFYILALLWSFDLALGIALGPLTPQADAGPHARRSFGLWSWIWLGLGLGSAILMRQVILLFVPFMAGWMLWVVGRTRWRSVLGGFAVSVLVLGLLIVPWTIRNYQAFGRFVLLNTNAGYAFFWANHPIQGTNFIPILWSRTYHDLIPRELLPLDEAALESALMARGIGFVTDEPGRYVLLSLSRVKDYFEFWPTHDSGAPSNIARVLSSGIYLPLMALGVWRATFRRTGVFARPQARAIMLLYLFATVYSLIHLLSWALVRYRLPVDAVLMPCVALGAVELANYLARARRPLAIADVRALQSVIPELVEE